MWFESDSQLVTVCKHLKRFRYNGIRAKDCEWRQECDLGGYNGFVRFTQISINSLLQGFNLSVKYLAAALSMILGPPLGQRHGRSSIMESPHPSAT